MKSITPQQLIEKYRERNTMGDHPNVIVVDVRSTDRIGGHIKGSINIPAHTFKPRTLCKHVESSIENFRKMPTYIVFHCMYSSVRGPGAAKRFQKFIDDNPECYDVDDIEILLLEGGFDNWINTKDNSIMEYTECFDDRIWVKNGDRMKSTHE